ncbi:MAG TPA: RNA polymerase sigma factor [Bryobacteraceae bacterium]|nr:RNA polymerase sigma factor [Bryobacteraceae bacterium]
MKAQTANSMEFGQASAARLEDVFRENYAMVYRAAYRVAGNASDAEDVLQTVFLRMLKRDPGAEAVGNVASYLHRAAVNAALDLVRSRHQIRSVSLDDWEPVLAESSHRGPERTREAGEIREWLRVALARLNPRIAEMFILKFIEGKENPEIARLLDTTPGTVAVTLSRTRDRLEKEFRSQTGGTV